MRNERTGNYSWEGYREVLSNARTEKARGNQSAVDQARRNIKQMGTRSMIDRLPQWMR